MKRDVEALVNRHYEYIGSDTNPNSGNEISLFKDDKGNNWAIEVYPFE